MTTVSKIVIDIVKARPMIYESISHHIVNFNNLAKSLKPEIDAITGKNIKLPTIIMSLRRFSENLAKTNNTNLPIKFNTEIIMKSGLSDFTIVRSPGIFSKFKKIYNLVDYEKGETLNVIHGNYELNIIISEKYTEELESFLGGEKILNKEMNLVSLTLSFSKDFFYTPGVLAVVTRRLAWEDINIIEYISTMTELIFIVNKKDATKAYNAMENLAKQQQF